MASETTIEVTLKNLRAIIHGLTMASFGFVEEKALVEINIMIKALPGPEALNLLDPEGVQQTQRDVGGIMRLIELYGKKDMEYKTRYESRTGLPPRYKVLDWRCPMEQAARDITRSMIKTSAVADDLGYADIANRLIKCAKKVGDNSIDEIELANITADTLDKIGFTEEAIGLRKAAQAMEIGVEDITGGFQQLYQVIDGIMSTIERKNDSIMGVPSAKKAMNLLGGLWQQLKQFRTSLDQPVSQLQQQAPAIEQALEATLPKSVFDAQDKKQYNIEWTEQDDSGEQTAFITKQDGQQYEVERDESGKMSVSDVPMGSAQSEAQPEAQYSQEDIQQWLEDMQANGYTPEQLKEQIASYNLASAWNTYVDRYMTEQATSGSGVGGGGETSAQSALEGLSRDKLMAIIKKLVPNAWSQGVNGKSVAGLTDNEMRDVVKNNVGEKIILDEYQKAAKSIFNLKRYSESK